MNPTMIPTPAEVRRPRPRPTLTITRGLPASGKTTWAKRQVLMDPTNTFRVERDELRFMLFGAPVGTGEQERMVTEVQTRAISALLSAGKNVIVSDTNLNPRVVATMKNLAKKHSAHFAEKVFAVDVDECIRRDEQRGVNGGRSCGEAVIRWMVARYGAPSA